MGGGGVEASIILGLGLLLSQTIFGGIGIQANARSP